MYGSPDGPLQGYFGHLPLPADEVHALREQHLDFGLFASEGEKSLTTRRRQA